MESPVELRLRIQVDRLRCVGSAVCRATAPGVFELDGQRLARPLRPVTKASVQIHDAVALCPMEAITVEPLGSAETPDNDHV